MDKVFLQSHICRICLRSVEDATSLFSDDHESKEILEKIYVCFQVIVNSENYLPNVICNSCIEELNMANNFRIKCVTFEERFTAYSKHLTNNKQEEIEDYKDISNEHNRFEPIGDTHESQDNTGGQYENDLLNTVSEDKINNVKFKCDICSKMLKTKASLQKHNISMHQKRKHIGKVTGSGVNRRYHCTKCSYSTPHSQTLVNHMRRHDGERPYHCYCGKSFTQSSSLAAHQKIHSNSTYFVCAKCGKQFKHAFSLKNHLRVHENAGFACSICSKTLKSQKTLQEHIHRHYNIRNFNCEDCGATFVSCSDLLNHKRNHNTEKTVECHLCGYKTHAKKNLVVHLKRHVGDKAYKCELCTLTVYTSSDLRRHLRVHTRDKPFSCPTCSQRFSHSPSLNKHVRNVHGGLHYKWGDFKSKNTKKLIKDEKV